MKNKDKKNKKKGFTLIEILAVVLIIGILVAIAVPTYQKAVEKSRTPEPLTTLKSIAKAEQLRKLAQGSYSDNVQDLDLHLTDFPEGNPVFGETFESKFFTYKLYGEDDAVATAKRRIDKEEDVYELSVDYGTGEIFCRPEGHYICLALGLDVGQDYERSVFDINNVQDWDNLTMIKYVMAELRPLWTSSCGISLDCLQEKLDKLCASNGKCLNKLDEYSSGGIMGTGFRWYMRGGYPVLGIKGAGEVGVGEVFFYNNGNVQLRGWYGTNNDSWNEIAEYLGEETIGSGSGWRFLNMN